MKSPIIAALGLDYDEDHKTDEADGSDKGPDAELGDALLAMFDALQRGDGARAARAYKAARDLCGE